MLENHNKHIRIFKRMQKKKDKQDKIIREFKNQKFMSNKNNKLKLYLFEEYKYFINSKAQLSNDNVDRIKDLYINTIKEERFNDYVKEYHNLTSIKLINVKDRFNIFIQYIKFYNISTLTTIQYNKFENDYKYKTLKF